MPKKSPSRRYRRRMDWVKVLATIHELEDSFGYPPSVSEVAVATGNTQQNTHRAIVRLFKEGFVDYTSRKPHRVRVVHFE